MDHARPGAPCASSSCRPASPRVVARRVPRAHPRSRRAALVGPAEPVPDAAEWDAVVPPTAASRPGRFEALAAMRAAVERGAALVAAGGAPGERDGFWADLLGVVAGPEPPARRVLRAGHRGALPHLGSRDPRVRGGRRLRPARADRPRQGDRRRQRSAAISPRWWRHLARRGPRRCVRPRQHRRRAAHARSWPSCCARPPPDLSCCGRNYRDRDRRLRAARRDGLSPRARRSGDARASSSSPS